MVFFTSLSLLSLAALGTLAAPFRRDGGWGNGTNGDGVGLTQDDANLIASKYAELIRTYTKATADAILTPDFIDYSESVNTLINSCPQGPSAHPLPLLQATFDSRAKFEQGQGEQPPINFEQLGLWYNSNAVTIRWKTTNTVNLTDAKPVVGIIVMDVVKSIDSNLYPYQISQVFSEFDSGAWLQNLQNAGICSGATAEPVPDGAFSAAPASPAASTTPAPAPPAAEVPGSDASPTPVVTEVATAHTTAYATETCTETAAATWRPRFMV